MPRLLPTLAVALLAVFLPTVSAAVDIKSIPYTDEVWKDSPQKIPGRLQFAYADKGQDVGFHVEGDCLNKCSCTFNKCDDKTLPTAYLDNFRSDECLTTCYTKSAENNFHNNFCCDTWASNGTLVEINQLFIGYTFVGNWYSYTVLVEEAGTYVASFYGSSHHGGTLSFDVDYKDQVKDISVASTGWWHNYAYENDLFELTFPTAGLHVVTVHIESIAPPAGFKEWGNLVWIDLVKKDAAASKGNVRGRVLE